MRAQTPASRSDRERAERELDEWVNTRVRDAVIAFARELIGTGTAVASMRIATRTRGSVGT